MCEIPLPLDFYVMQSFNGIHLDKLQLIWLIHLFTGLTWEEAKQRVPPGVVPACHNAEDTVTISGDQESVEKFVAELQEEGVFARSVNSANVAFHSPHMAQIAPMLLEALERVSSKGIL